MWCPASGILDPFAYTIALAENAVRNGVEYFLNCAFLGEERQPDGTHLLRTEKGDFHTRWVVNSAGLHSAAVSAQLGIPGYVIKPVKGEYFVLDKLAGQFAKIPVYPAPNPDNTFDTHATPTVDGNVLIGPGQPAGPGFPGLRVHPGRHGRPDRERLPHVPAYGQKLFYPQLCRHPAQAGRARPPGTVQDFVLETRTRPRPW